MSGVRAAVGVSTFNLFSGMGGKRSKVTETDLWKEGQRWSLEMAKILYGLM